MDGITLFYTHVCNQTTPLKYLLWRYLKYSLIKRTRHSNLIRCICKKKLHYRDIENDTHENYPSNQRVYKVSILLPTTINY